ncbi:MAG: MBOAT family protein, partial [Anaerolineae bacterium]|nr:MBOAT family protein [Anaerolineae bacterium]
MNFISIAYIVFFIVVAFIYFRLPQQQRWILLLVASYFFYAYWEVTYLILIVFSTFVDYFVARLIGATPQDNQVRRRALITISLLINLGTLFVFKYFNFFADSLNDLLIQLGLNTNLATLEILLPVGISFYTFQSMSYTIDVYRGHIQPEKHFGVFATYIAFFPQLVAGPIERAGNMLPQFFEDHRFDYARIVSGLRLMLWGAFKKVVIADRIAEYVNTIYGRPEDYTGTVLILGTLLFAFQIYCDFSGYSDIAIGTARIFGFDLMTNFRQPYLSRSFREFWRRWHISLSTWFRDYVYIPLGGNRVPFSRNILNLLIVFVVSGLW